MNDRFKFRVWNKHINEYCNIQNLFILPTGETGYFITDGSYPHQRKFIHQEDMIIEMSTGLSDKNGNLIYEGDIIQNSDKDQYVVEWCIDGYWYIRQTDDEKFGCALASIKTLYDGWEIIGNIHEQAEQKDVKRMIFGIHPHKHQMFSNHIQSS